MSYQTYTGVPLADCPIDNEVARIASENPQYREFIVKEGLNPIAPAGSVEVQRQTGSKTNFVTVVYAVLATAANAPTVNYNLGITGPVTNPGVAVTTAMTATTEDNPLPQYALQVDQQTLKTQMNKQNVILEEEHTELDIMWILIISILVIFAGMATTWFFMRH